MQSMRDQLLKAGLVTAEQAERSANAKNKGKQRHDRRDGPRDAGPKAPTQGAAGPDPQPKKKGPSPKHTPIPRMVDLSDPIQLKIFQAIETHRFRGDTLGEHPFYFTLRDGRVRKLFVTPEISAELEGGKLAIVENGDLDRHVIVAAEAVASIREADPEAVRFAN